MIKNLTIQNYTLIKELEISPSPNLNIITGETGAGKSILLGAIELLLGGRADTKSLNNESEKCIIEAVFDIHQYTLSDLFLNEDIDYETHCIIRREINSQGKSRAFVNDTPVNLEFLKKLGSKLVDVHSQHETMELANSGFQLSILDAFANNFKELSDYKTTFKEFQKLQAKLSQLEIQAEEEKKQLSYNSFLYNELDLAELKVNEQEELEQNQKILSNAEDINEKLLLITNTLQGEHHSILPSLIQLEKSFSQISQFQPSWNNLTDRFRSVLEELKDIYQEVAHDSSIPEPNPNELAKIEQRLSLIYALQKKHKKSNIEDLLVLKAELESKISSTNQLDTAIENTRLEIKKLEQALLNQATILSNTRTSQIETISSQLVSLLKELGIPNANLQIDHKSIKPSNSGIDEINILFSANKGVKLQDLRGIASGGEFSRLMLCIKYLLADKTALPTIIFDEIDTGISGEIARKVGKMMRQMAKSHQVISITHLPQMASQGDLHYFVYKDHSSDKSSSKIKLLNKDERINEIAQMLSGSSPSKSAIQNAKDLLNDV